MRAKLVILFGILLIVFFPSQLGFHFWPSWASPEGIRVDYLSPTLLFIDILALVFIILSKPPASNFKILFLFSIVNILLSAYPQISFFHWLRVFLYYLVFLSFIKYLIYFKKYWLSALALSVLWPSSLAVMQFIRASSLGGVWYWFGERPLSLALSYISKVYLPGLGYLLRPYAAFPHPNALAGYLLVSLIILIQYKKHWITGLMDYWIIILGTIALLLTFSKVAIIIALVLLIMNSKKHIYISVYLLLGFLYLYTMNSSSITERIIISRNAIIVLQNYLVTGTGLGAYPAAAIILPSTGLRLSYQPVHNIFLLLLTELGLPLFLLVLYKLYKIYYSHKRLLNIGHGALVISLLSTATADHYWLTSPSNVLLLIFVIALIKSSSALKKPNSI